MGSIGVVATAIGAPSLDSIEMLAWSDPERAVQLIDSAPSSADDPRLDLQELEVRGMVYAEVRRDADVNAVIARLQLLARDGNSGASVAERYVRAYSSYQRDQYAAANAESNGINIDAVRTLRERYRISILRGNSLRF